MRMQVLSTWFLQDTTWKVPKLNVSVKLETLQTLATPTGVALTDVFCSCLKEILSEFSYYADCAGLMYNVSLAMGGLELTFGGYHDKLPVLVNKVLAEMKKMGGETPCPNDCYLRMKEKVLRSYYNTRFSQPYSHCILGSSTCLEDPRWSSDEKYAALTASSLSDFHTFSAQFVRQMKADVLVHGNATAEEAKVLTASIVAALDFLPLSLSQEPLRRNVCLAKGTEYIYRQHSKTMNAKEPNSAVEVILFVGNREGRSADRDTPVSVPLSTSATSDDNNSSKQNNKIANESILELLVHLISEPAFDQLRTKEQLGYIVHTSSKKIGPLCGLQMIVQSSHKDPAYLDTRIELFLESFRATLGAFTEEELKTNIQAVIEKLLEKPKNLDQESMRHWEEIKNAFYLFDRKERLAKHLRNVKLSDCTEFFDLYIAAQSGERRKVSSQLFGKGSKYPKSEAGTNRVIVKNPIEFKRAMSLEPMCTFSAN